MKIKKVRKQEMVMINQSLRILHTASFFLFFKSELSVSSWSIPALTTIKENNSSYLCTDHLECSKHFLQCRISG